MAEWKERNGRGQQREKGGRRSERGMEQVDDNEGVSKSSVGAT